MRVLRYEGVVIDVPEWCVYVGSDAKGEIFAYNSRPTITLADPTTWTSIGASKVVGNLHRKNKVTPGPLCNAHDLVVSPSTMTWALHVLGKFDYRDADDTEQNFGIVSAPSEADYDKAMHVLQKIHGIAA